jgi:hypothetical protein
MPGRAGITHCQAGSSRLMTAWLTRLKQKAESSARDT